MAETRLEWNLSDLMGIAGAQILRWTGPDRVVFAHDYSYAGVGVLFWPWRSDAVGMDLYDYLATTGCAGVVLDQGQELPSMERYPRLGVITVPNGMAAYARLARYHRDYRIRQSKIVGVTGSVGKTSTVGYLASIFDRQYTSRATQDNINRIANCCGLVMETNSASEAAIIEMGFMEPGDIDLMGYASSPDAAVITSLAPQHLAFVGGSAERVYEEKSKLALHVAQDGFVVVRRLDVRSGRIDPATWKCKTLVFGPDPGCDATYNHVQITEHGTEFTLQIGGQAQRVWLQAVGEFQAANATAAALVALRMDVPWVQVIDGLEATKPAPNRFSVNSFRTGLTIVNDSYSSGYEAMLRGADAAAMLAGTRRKVAFVSRVTSLGDYGLEYHRLAGEHLASLKFDEVVIVGTDHDAFAIRAGLLGAGMAAGSVRLITGTADIAPTLATLARPDTLVYCKMQYYLKAAAEVARVCSALRSAGL